MRSSSWLGTPRAPLQAGRPVARTSARTLWLRRLVAAAVIALALGWLPYQVYGRSGLARLVKMRGERAGIERDNLALRDENAHLRAELQLSDDDELGVIERVARDELGLVKPGEIVFTFEGKTP